MKIAIQGHPTRGKEVIQILESLGGINADELEGTYKTFYYIDYKNEISDDHIEKFPSTYNLYTLEEFEKKFPFKIGDKVIYDYTPNFVGIVVDIKFDDNIPYRVDLKGTICTCETMMLKPYKEMKEERNITLTLDKAKEWYKKGGELREIALQVFSEKELNPLPKSWEEFIESIKFTFSGHLEYIDGIEYRNNSCFLNKSIGESSEICDKHVALFQLEQLRNYWWGDWKPEWDCFEKHVIKWKKDDLIVFIATRVHAFLVFPTREMAEEFLKCFRDLIEKAGDLI